MSEELCFKEHSREQNVVFAGVVGIHVGSGVHQDGGLMRIVQLQKNVINLIMDETNGALIGKDFALTEFSFTLVDSRCLNAVLDAK